MSLVRVMFSICEYENDNIMDFILGFPLDSLISPFSLHQHSPITSSFLPFSCHSCHFDHFHLLFKKRLTAIRETMDREVCVPSHTYDPGPLDL